LRRRVGQVLAAKARSRKWPCSLAALHHAASRASKKAWRRDFPGIKIVDKQYGDEDFGQSLKVSENMLTASRT